MKSTHVLAKEKYAHRFEEMCRDILDIKYNQYDFQLYGRQGQAQDGLDIIGYDKDTGKYGPLVAQCKNYLSDTTDLKDAIDKDIKTIKSKKSDVNHIIIMTARDRDRYVQDYVNGISNVSVKIEIMFWDEISDFILDHEELLEKYYQLSRHKEITTSPSNITARDCQHRDSVIDSVKEKLSNNKSVVLLNGLGGVGKTTIASKIYNDIKEQYNITGWYVYRDSMEETLLSQTNKFKDEKENRLAMILNYIQSSEGKKLLCIDNLDEKSERDTILQNLTGKPNLTILATSRMNQVQGFESKEIELLSENECVDLFKGYCERKISEKIIREFVRLVSNHTLGVELLAKSISRRKDPEVFLAELKEKGFQFPTIKSKTKHTNNESQTIAQHLKCLFDITEKSEEEKRILYYFSIMPSIEIPGEVLDWIGCDEDVEQSLCDTGWIKYNDPCYYMHPLIKETILLDKDKFPKNLGEEFVEYASKNDIADKSEPYITVLPKLEIADSLLKNINILEDEKLGKIYNGLGELFYNQSKFIETEEYFSKALEIRKKVLGEEHQDTAESYNNFGELYDSHGKYEEAEEYYKKALAIREKVLGEEHQDTAESYNNLGLLYKKQGKYEEAEEYYKKALAICEKVYGKDHPDTATSYNNLGGLYYEQGKNEEAEEYYKKALAICEKVYGKDHPSTATSYNNLGGLYSKQGKYKEAEEYYKKALAILIKVLGESHPLTASNYNNLGLLYHNQGKYKEAEEYYKKDLAICEKVYGKEHPYTATSYNNLGGLYYKQGRYDKAEEYFKKALPILKKIYKNDHPKITNISRALRYLYLKKVELKSGKKLW